MKKQELQEVQILRGISFLAVIMQHVLAGLVFEPYLTEFDGEIFSVLLALTRFAVPMFIFITGLVLFYNYYEKIDYLTFIKKRFKDIVIPYILWSIVFFLVFNFPFKNPLLQITHLIESIFTGKAAYHLWYMIMIIQFYIFVPLFICLFKKFEGQRKNILFLIGSFLVYLLLMWFSGGISFRDRTFIWWYFYFLMGAYAGIYTEKWKKFISVFRYENFVVYLICFLCVAYRMVHSARFNPAKSGYEINFNLSAPLSPLMTVFAISAIILIYYLAQNFLSSKNFLQSTLYSFGKYSFGGYLIHPLLLIASFASTKMIADLSVRMAAAFVLCAILSLFSTILVSRIPFIGTVFVGKIRRK